MSASKPISVTPTTFRSSQRLAKHNMDFTARQIPTSPIRHANPSQFWERKDFSKTPTSDRGVSKSTPLFGRSPIALTDHVDKHGVKPIVFMTDWEPDDIIAFSMLAKALGNSSCRLAIVSGGANATIQNARAKAYVERLQQDGFLKKASITFIQGTDSNQEFIHQGEDVLTKSKIIDITKKPSSGPETDVLKKFITNNSEALVFCLKQPSEILEHPALIPLFQHAKLIAYAGGFNIQTPDKSVLQKFYASFHKTLIVQSFTALQGANSNNPNYTAPKTTPLFTDALTSSKLVTIEGLRHAIHLWNEKMLYDLGKEFRDSDTSPIEDEQERQKHQRTQAKLRQIIPDKMEDFRPNNNTRDALGGMLSTLSPKALYEGNPIGHWIKVVRQILDNFDTQTVIADPLAILAAVEPNLVTEVSRGDVHVDRFISVTENKKGNAFHIDAIGASMPKERISVIDRFLRHFFPGI